MKKIYTLAVIVVLFSITTANSQIRNKRVRDIKGSSSHLKGEIGGNIGVSNFQGDYTQEGPGNGRIVANGISVNATYSLHFKQIKQKWKSFKERKRSFRSLSVDLRNRLILKSNLGYTNATFDNLGISTGKEPLNPSKTPNNILLGRASSKTSIISFGTQLEYYFSNMLMYLHQSHKYRGTGRRTKKGVMYVGIGFGINHVNSEYDYNVPSNIDSNGGLPDRYTPQVLKGLENEIIFSGNFAIGYRYKLNSEINLVAELKTNYYFSDRIDATDTTPDTGLPTGIANEFNDYNTVVSIGAIYHLF